MLAAASSLARHSGAMDPDAPLLFFDSGVGGLSVLRPTRALLPNAPIVYAADNAAFPYGKRSEAEIAERVPGPARPAGRAVPARGSWSSPATPPARSRSLPPCARPWPCPSSARSRRSSRRRKGQHHARHRPAGDVRARCGRRYTQALIRRVRTRLHGAAPWVGRTRRTGGTEAARRNHRPYRRLSAPRSPVFFCSTSPAATGSTSIVLACTHFPLLATEIARRFPSAQVDAARRHRAADRLPHPRPAMDRAGPARHCRVHSPTRPRAGHVRWTVFRIRPRSRC